MPFDKQQSATTIASEDSNGTEETHSQFTDFDDDVDNDDLGTEHQCCAICLMEYSPGDEVCTSTNAACTHSFHKSCILSWLLQSKECPYCRQIFLEADEQEEEQAKEEESSAAQETMATPSGNSDSSEPHAPTESGEEASTTSTFNDESTSSTATPTASQDDSEQTASSSSSSIDVPLAAPEDEQISVGTTADDVAATSVSGDAVELEATPVELRI